MESQVSFLLFDSCSPHRSWMRRSASEVTSSVRRQADRVDAAGSIWSCFDMWTASTVWPGMCVKLMPADFFNHNYIGSRMALATITLSSKKNSALKWFEVLLHYARMLINYLIFRYILLQWCVHLYIFPSLRVHDLISLELISLLCFSVLHWPSLIYSTVFQW